MKNEKIREDEEVNLGIDSKLLNNNSHEKNILLSLHSLNDQTDKRSFISNEPIENEEKERLKPRFSAIPSSQSESSQERTVSGASWNQQFIGFILDNVKERLTYNSS